MINKLIFLAISLLLVTAIPNVYAGNGDMFCDGKNRDYEGISELPELEDGQCYGTCEQMSKGLACDIEEIQK